MGEKKYSSRLATKLLTFKNSVIMSSVTTLAVVPSIVVGSTIQLSSKYSLDGQSFMSKNSAINYVKNNSKKIASKMEGTNSTWQLSYNGATKTFSDPESLREFTDSLITKKGTYATSTNLSSESSSTKAIESIDWNSMLSLNNTKEGQNLTKTIYQGLHDKSYDNIDDAINSFYTSDSVKSAYYFNGVYFSNKDDLKNYLISIFLPNENFNDSYKTIVLNGPNGTKSNPINIGDATTAAASIKSFIENNSDVSVQYKNSEFGETVNITESNVNQTMDKVSNKDLSYVSMKSNEGESRYILDNYDSSNLIGPYQYNGVLDIGSFMNKSMWKKVNKVSKQVYVESKINTMIGTFFSSVISDDKALSLSMHEQDPTADVPLFRTTLLAADGENSYFTDASGKEVAGQLSLDDWFLKQLEIISPELKSEVMEANLQMMKGNKYNTFYKISVLYSYLLQRIVTRGLGQEAIDLVVYYFTQVCNYIQDAIELILMDSSLLVNSDGKKFNVKDVFEIGNMNYDLNTNPDYFFNKVKEWPKMVAGMDAYLAGYNNLVMTTGLVPFASYDQSYLVENGLIKDEELQSIKISLEKIYSAFSQSDYSSFLSIFADSSTNATVKKIVTTYDSSEWEKKIDEAPADHSNASIGVILKSLIQQNNQHQNLARSLLLTEIRIYIATGSILPNGYLSLFYSKTPSANKIDQFVDFVQSHQELDAYKVYMVFLLDMRMNTNIINSNSLSSVNSFRDAIMRIAILTLGTSVLVSNSISKLYNNTSSSRSSQSLHSLNTTTHGLTTNNNAPESKYKVEYATLADRLEMQRNLPTAQNSPMLSVLSNASVGSSSSSSSSVRSEVLYINPKDLFVKTSNRGTVSANKIITVASIEPRSSAGLVSGGTSKKITTHYKFNGDIYAQVTRVSSTTTLPQSSTVKNKNGSVFHSNLNSGMSISNGNLSVILPFDETRIMNAANTSPNNATIRKSFKATPDFTGNRMSFTNRRSGSYEVNSVTTFSSSFRSKISVNKVYDLADSAWKSTKKIAKAIKDAIMPVMSLALSSLETYFFILDLITETKTQDFYVYTASDGTEFIWDGGLTVSKFLGFDVKTVSDIDSMKLITPIQVTLPQVEEYYYYNGKKYYDIKDLKRAQLLYIIKNKYNGLPNSYQLNYSLVDSDKNLTTATSTSELFNIVMKDMGVESTTQGTYDFSKIKSNSKYISSITSGIKGTESLSSTDYGNIANVIIESIRPTNIAQLPNVDSLGKTTGSISEFVLPTKYYDPKTKKIVDNTTTNQYIIENSANNKTTSGEFSNTNASDADKKSKENLKKSFDEKMKNMISTKDVLYTDYLSGNKKYSDLNANWSVVNVYEVKLPNESTKLFESINDARSYVLDKLKFQKNADLKETTAYVYKGIYFNNEEELKRWVINNLSI